MNEPGKQADGLRDRLTDEQYEVTQNSGTERPFSGKYIDNKEDGTYRCVAGWKYSVPNTSMTPGQAGPVFGWRSPRTM